LFDLSHWDVSHPKLEDAPLPPDSKKGISSRGRAVSTDESQRLADPVGIRSANGWMAGVPGFEE